MEKGEFLELLADMFFCLDWPNVAVQGDLHGAERVVAS